MAIISTLRTKMTKWVVGFVAVAISAFILNDLFGYGKKSLFDWNANNVGKIAGHSVSLEEFQNTIQERESSYYLNTGRQPGENEKIGLQQQAWELLIARHAIVPQMEKLGVAVSEDELWDMIQGRNMEEGIKQSFTDSLGRFDRNRLISYIKMLNEPRPADPQRAAMWQEGNIRWQLYENELKLGRQRIKYENMLIKTNYVTKAEMEREYHAQNDVVDARFLYVPYVSVSDSSVSVSDDELQRYYDKNKNQYKAGFTRDINYVSFPLTPSAQDSAAVLKNAQKIAADFATVTEDSLFAASNTDGSEAFRKYHIGNLPASLSAQWQTLRPGQLMGPTLEGGSYKITKIVKAGTDSISYAKASHILIKWTAETPEAKKEAKEKAQKILDEIKKGADFAAKARENGQDGTAGVGGDLGWFKKGQMVKPFENVVFGATREGLIPTLVETKFGYHIIKVTNVKDNRAFTVATVEIQISPSDETTNAMYQKAQVFADNLSGVDAFKERASKDTLFVQEARMNTPDSRFIGNLGEARKVVSWLFRDGKIGKVSDVIDLGDKYVVAVMTGEVKEGSKPFEMVKDEVTIAVKKQLKGKKIIEKLGAATGELEQVATGYGADATVNSSGSLKLSSNTIPVVGVDSEAVGRFFGVSNGKRSAPFDGENGVFVVQCNQKVIAPEIADYSAYKNSLMQSLSTRDTQIVQALKDESHIKDERYRFY